MHIYPLQIDCTPQSIEHRCLDYCCSKLGRSSRYSTMHIYPLQIDPSPLLQLSIDLWKTITPNMFHIYPWQIDPTPSPPIKHRSLENHYTKYISYIAQCMYTHGRLKSQSI